MKITVKTLQQKTFNFEVEPSDTVLQVKEKIAAQDSLNASSIDLQKLIFSGKILENEKLLSDYGVKDGDFIVLMVTKPKVEKKQTAPAATPAPATPAAKQSSGASQSKQQQQQQPAAPQKKEGSVMQVQQQQQQASPSGGGQFSTGASALLSGEQYQAAVNNLCEMGFTKEEVVKAMRAAFNNPDRAVEYLMSGIPAELAQSQAGAGGSDENASTTATAGGDVDAAGEGDMDDVDVGGVGEEYDDQAMEQGPSPFDELRQVPQFEQLRQMVLTNPQMLEPILGQLAQSHPHLLQLIAQNPQQFFQWLAYSGGEGGVPEGATVIRLTREENEAIERLVALGFDRNSAVEAYLACDKNEMLAANYLFDLNQQDFQ
ncbi:hypothetical protein MIR68_007548 [Amoeboaphelidium protococcarum]|nr:hypothetical protein MIR68_007548 [Amoeboaphelidium protococcarum]